LASSSASSTQLTCWRLALLHLPQHHHAIGKKPKTKSEKSSPDSYSPGRYSLHHNHFGRKTLDLLLLTQNMNQTQKRTTNATNNKQTNTREPRLAELECGWHTVERMKMDENILTRWHSSVIYIYIYIYIN
jgi:hypothetical protein